MLVSAQEKLNNCGVGLELAEADDLGRLTGEIEALAAQCVQGNPFFRPEFLGPALANLDPPGNLKLAIVRNSSSAIFFAPCILSRNLGPRSGLMIRIWTHAYAPLGTPLIANGKAAYAAQILIDAFRSRGVTALAIPDVPLDDPEIAKIRKITQFAGGTGFVAAPTHRPILYADHPAGAGLIDQTISKKRRKELARQWRRLQDEGPVEIARCRQGADLAAAGEAFLEIERKGWKGRAGTALAQNSATAAFARSTVEGMARSGAVEIDLLRVAERPIAALVKFTSGSVAIPWKIAFDEAFARFSPGAQLLLDATRCWLEAPEIQRVDPVCEADSPALRSFWRDQEPYGILHLNLAGKRWPTQVIAGAETANFAIRQKTRGLRSRLRFAANSTRRAPHV